MNTSKSPAPTLTQVFGFDDIPFVTNVGRQRIREFASRFPAEVTLHDDGDSATFNTEDIQFRVRHDLDEELHVVYEGTITSFCPQRQLFTTGYRHTLESVINRLRDGSRAVFNDKDKEEK